MDEPSLQAKIQTFSLPTKVPLSQKHCLIYLCTVQISGQHDDTVGQHVSSISRSENCPPESLTSERKQDLKESHKSRQNIHH